VHPLMMGLEEHLLAMFRDDFEFHDGAASSHLGSHGGAGHTKVPALASAPTTAASAAPVMTAASADLTTAISASAPAADHTVSTPITVAHWAPDAESELRKIPFFVRGKARRNTERFASDRGVATITVETLYDAKAHYSR
jgi:light-independent protochlorophyllide reductase subunit B